MGLTTYERQERIMRNGRRNNEIYDLVRAIKAEVSGDTRDMIDQLVKLLTNK